MKIWTNILRRQKLDSKNTSVEYTESLDTIMLDSWIKCTNGDHRYVRNVVVRLSEQTDEDTENWHRIYNEFIERYGLSKHYLKLLATMRKLALLEIKYARSLAEKKPDRFLETLISIQEAALTELLKDNGRGMSVEQSLPVLSEKMGFPIRTHETTFIEYQNYLESYARSSKAS